MRRILAVGLVVGVGSLGNGCVKDDGSVFIRGAIPISLDDDCLAKSGGDVFVSGGTLDVLQPRPFRVPLDVITNLPSTFNNTDVTSGDTKAPNFPDYGATDNNVIIFKEAAVDFSFTVSADDVGNIDPDAFDCDGEGNCESNLNNPALAAIAGSLFNPQTSLNSSTALFVDAIPVNVAVALNSSFEALLTNPDQRITVIATMRLRGNTTGNGELRDLSTFPFPFPVDICRGCRTPDQNFCESVNEDASSVSAPVAGCILGQDASSGFCGCDIGAGLFAPVIGPDCP